jgi:hypothetical protein
MSEQPTLLFFASAIAGAEARIARQRRRLEQSRDPTGIAESATALELMQLQRNRLERHCLAAASCERGPLQ